VTNQRFRDKKVVVIGGNSGIGLATAAAFDREGAHVAIVGRNPVTLEAARRALGPETLALRADVSRLADLDEVAAILTEKMGRIDVLFANAGIGAMVPFEHVTETIWDDLMNVNLKGMYFSVQKLAPLISRGGAIVLCSSIGAVRSWPGSTVYSASKAAINALGRGIAVELLPRNIRVNIVMPGGINTPIFSRTPGLPAAAADDIRRQMAEHTPMRRLGDPDEVAAAVLFLASDQASFITATELVVDGGVVGCAS
jgi:NAD(P)-dependent dehydrogenase (short-subunit alcohol dehydrogenase family)